jgi:hypothetical protein
LPDPILFRRGKSRSFIVAAAAVSNGFFVPRPLGALPFGISRPAVPVSSVASADARPHRDCQIVKLNEANRSQAMAIVLIHDGRFVSAATR